MARAERAEARKKALTAPPPPDAPPAAPPPATPAAVDISSNLALPSIDVIEVQIDALQQKMDAEWATASSAVTDRLRRPALPRDFPRRTAAEQRRKRWMAASEEMDAAFACDAPAMCTVAKAPNHRHKDQAPLFPACVARPVSKAELFAEPTAMKALKAE